MCTGDWTKMSIINDALKKAQASLEKKSKKKSEDKTSPSPTVEAPKIVKGSIKKKKAWYKTIVALISVFFFIIGILLTILLFLMKESSQTTISSNNIRTRLKPAIKRNYAKDELILSGLTSIGSKSAAIINDDVYQVGEEVNGYIIEAINLKEVVATHLESGNKKRLKVK